MDHPSHAPPPTNDTQFIPSPSAGSTPSKRQRSTDDGPPPKKIKAVVEVPQLYSDAVRKKLAATSRTGQACDRCKERKMKCDTDPVACQPCRQKNLRCYTTDRVTGQSRERGQNNRTENELQFLREQNAAYEQRYGPLQPADIQQPSAGRERNGTPRVVDQPRKSCAMPSVQYVGWPAPDHTAALQHGPVNGTEVDIIDEVIDIADFECKMMEEYPPSELGKFNVSRTSITNTTTGYQTITEPSLPPKDEAVQAATAYLVVMNQYAPILHRPSFMKTVHQIYDQPQHATLAERVQLAMVLSIIAFQTATRNHNEAAEKFEKSHYWLHYALTWYRELIRERSLASMQALALILLHFRNTPKPGYSWSFGHNLIMKAIELDYHRDPDKIQLAPSENNPLAKELRKRVFHSILGICVTTGCRVSKPAPWQFQHFDVPLPAPVQDAELTETSMGSITGKCDFWPCLQLARLLPLLTELYNHITAVRPPEAEYIKIIEILHTKIDAWRKDWDDLIKGDEIHVNLKVATLLMETWAAEYILNLYHPMLCPARSPEVMERHLDICHKQAQRLLKSFHTLSQRYKGVDFTWHSTAAYAMGFGVTLHIYRCRKVKVTGEQFDAMMNELKGWMSLMAYADLVMRTGNHLQHIFGPRVRRLEQEYRELTADSGNDTASQQPIATAASDLSTRDSTNIEGNHIQVGPGSTPSGHPPHASQQADHAAMFANHDHNQAWPSVFMGQSTGPVFPSYVPHQNQFHTVSTSLAPLLNDPANAFVAYPPTSTVPNEMMVFSPALYTDGTTVWPTITLPPQEQRFSQNQG